MREIKFRAWDTINDQMHAVSVIDWQRNSAWIGEKKDIYVQPFVDIIFMQFTGLKDKNGKEIYEGDIVAESTIGKPIWDRCGIVEERPIGEVVIEPPFINIIPRKKGWVRIVKTRHKLMKKGNYWELNLSRYDGLFEWHKDDLDIEVVGNIYENPDLLKEKE